MNKGTNGCCVVLEDVTRVALQLQSKGMSVTTRSVRKELGRGSYSTIGRLLAELGLRALEENIDASLSAQVRLQALTLARTIWRAAESAQAEKAAAVQAQWLARLSAVSHQLKREKAERCAIDSRLAVYEGERALMKQEIARLRGELKRRKRLSKKRNDGDRVTPSSIDGRGTADVH